MHTLRRLGWNLGTILVLSLIVVTSALAEKRVALVIGNGEYKSVPKLPNPPNDASDVEDSLKRLNFSVRKVINGRYDDMRRALLQFGRDARTADIALVFYAGHGIEVGGENWLIPTDAELRTDIDVDHEAISLRSILPILENSSKLGLIILDACRNNPFDAKMKRTIRRRAVSRGLAEVEPTGNVLVAYAAKDGTTAADGNGRNSPYTASLLKYIEQPGMEINFLFRNVRDDVIAATRREQFPFVYGSLSRDAIYLKPPQKKPPAMRPDEMAWTFLRDNGGIPALRKFISQFPTSPFALAARDRIAALQQAADAIPKPPRPDDIAWNLLQNSDNIAVLKNFLQQFPKSPFAPAARDRIAALQQAADAKPKLPQADDIAWNLLQNSDNIAVLKNFLQQFPKSLFAPAARDRIAALQQAADAKPKPPQADDIAWKLLQTSGNIAVLKNFLQRFPESPFAPAARDRIAALQQADDAKPKPLRPDDIAWTLLQNSEDIDVLKRFVRRFPDSPHRGLADARIASLQAAAATPAAPSPAPVVAPPREIVPLPVAAPPRPNVDPSAFELAFWNSIKDSDNPGEFASYLKRYPRGAFVPLAKLRLEDLKKPPSRTTPAVKAPAAASPPKKVAPRPTRRAKADPGADVNSNRNRQPSGGSRRRRYAPGTPEARANGDRLERNCSRGYGRACQALQRACQSGRRKACLRLRRVGR